MQLVGQQFWRLEHVSDSSETAQLNAHEVQKNVSEQLVDRIIVSNHGDSQLQYLFYGFMPRSNIDMPWPYNKSKYAAYARLWEIYKKLCSLAKS